MLEDIFKEKEGASQLHELLMLVEIFPRKLSVKALEEEYGRINSKKLLELIESLESIGFLKFL